jgi:hypothetical protein
MAAPSSMLAGAHYDDEAGDTVALDYVRDTLAPTASKTGAPTVVVSGKFDAALLLDAAEYVEYDGTEFLNALGTTGTVEAWIKPGYSGSPSTQQNFVYIVEDGGFVDRVSIWHTASGFLELYVNGSAGTVIASVSKSWTPTAGTWYHIAASWNASTAWLWANGTEQGNASVTGARAGTANYLAIGYDKSAAVAQDFTLDELAVFDTALYTTAFTPPAAAWDMTPAGLYNPSFEIPATQDGAEIVALPDGWGLNPAAVENAAATFGPPIFFVETFEALWSGNEDYIQAFAPSDLEAALFGTDPITVYDSFETEWSGNEDYIQAFIPENLVAAEFSSSADEHESFEKEWPARHPVADSRWITATLPSTTPSVIHARLNEIKDTYNLHIADAGVHTAADSTNTIVAADATDLATSITLAVEMWADCWTHMLDVALAYHLAYTRREMKKPSLAAEVFPPTTYDHLQAVAFLLTVALDMHFTWLDNAGPGAYEAFDPTATNIFAFPISASGGQRESFETQWKGNQDYIDEFIPANLVAAEFITNGSPDEFESFEAAIDLEVVLGASSEGAPQDVDDTLRVRVTISGTFVATLVVRARRKGSTSWTDIDTAYGPGDVDVPSGYEAIRMYTDAYTSGTPTAVWKWGVMETR